MTEFTGCDLITQGVETSCGSCPNRNDCAEVEQQSAVDWMGVGIISELRCVVEKGRPRVSCPKWYREGMVDADFIYFANGDWRLTPRGSEVLSARN